MSKPSMFIGSSTESKWIMKKIQDTLSDSCEVKSWDQDLFLPGEFPLESLHRQIIQSDFALLIVSPDDKIVKRQERGYVARDNILFELGLFTGVLGRHRSFCLSVADKRGGRSKEVLIPSDLFGLTRLDVTLVDDEIMLETDLQRICNDLIESIKRHEKDMVFTLLPSTALAIGYFDNFVVQVCKALSQGSKFYPDKYTKVTRGNFKFHIVLPDTGAHTGHEGFLRFLNSTFAQNHHLQKVEIEGVDKARRFPFYVDTLIEDGRTVLYDYPTTLRAAYDAIQYMRPAGITDEEIGSMERREIAHFESTLRYLLKSKPEAAAFGDKISIIYVNELDNR